MASRCENIYLVLINGNSTIFRDKCFAYLFEQVLYGSFGFFFIFCRLRGDIGYGGELGIFMEVSLSLLNNQQRTMTDSCRVNPPAILMFWPASVADPIHFFPGALPCPA